jgi:hypothetical protein
MTMDQPKRVIEVQFQQWRPQLLTRSVAVPEDWTDDKIKAELSRMYEEIDPADDNWCDQVDYDPKEGVHELTGEGDPRARPDLVYPPEEDDDGND